MSTSLISSLSLRRYRMSTKLHSIPWSILFNNLAAFLVFRWKQAHSIVNFLKRKNSNIVLRVQQFFIWKSLITLSSVFNERGGFGSLYLPLFLPWKTEVQTAKLFKVTVLWEGLDICWQTLVDLGLNKSRSWTLTFSNAPPSENKYYISCGYVNSTPLHWVIGVYILSKFSCHLIGQSRRPLLPIDWMN